MGWKAVIGLPARVRSSRGVYMAAPRTHEITALLRAWTAGDEQALEKLTPLVYSELRRRAHRYMVREPVGYLRQGLPAEELSKPSRHGP
jgi:ECF sigma factor